MNPTYVFYCARVVKIQDKATCKYLGGRICNHDSAPGGLAGGLHAALYALGVRGKPGMEDKVLVVQLKVGGRIINYCSLVDVKIQAFGGLELKGGLHAGR